MPEKDDATHEEPKRQFISSDSEEGEKLVEDERRRSFGMDYTSDEFKEKNPVAAAQTPGHEGGPSSTEKENEAAGEYNDEVVESIPEDLKDDDSKATSGKSEGATFGDDTEEKYSPTT